MRKTLNFEEGVYRQIQRRRAKILMENNVDVTFTEMVNRLLMKLFVMEVEREEEKKEEVKRHE